MSNILNILSDRRAAAAVEFAIIAPFIFAIFGGIGDFGLMMYEKSDFANAVSQAAQYALLTGPSATGKNIASALKNGATNNNLSQTVTNTITTTINGQTSGSLYGPACFCITGTTLPTSSTAMTSSYACPSASSCSGGTWGIYAQIKATFTYTPLTPFYSKLASTGTTVTETIIVKLN